MSTTTTETITKPLTPQSSCSLESNQPYTLTVPSNELPLQKVLHACARLTVQDSQGQTHTFRSLYEGTSQRTLFIFVRHFFCGLCQEYLRTLSQEWSTKELDALAQPTRIVVIGSGAPDLIKQYAERSECIFPIYADRTRKLYESLGMLSTLEMGAKPKYQTSGTVDVVVRSFFQTAFSGSNIFKSGNYSQIGGEFLVKDGKVVWCHRMKNTRDHTEMSDLRKVLES